MASCSTSDVASDGFFQKRKYKSGWYKNSSSSYYKTRKAELDDVAKNTSVKYKTDKAYAPKIITTVNVTSEAPVSSNEAISENSFESNEYSSENESLSSNEVIENSFSGNQISEEWTEYISNSEENILETKEYSSDTKDDEIDLTLLYVLCFFIPVLAVGLATDWDVNKVLINLLLTLLCVIPGIIHAFIVVKEARG